MLEKKKKRKRTSSVTPNKMITKVSLFQEGDTNETISKTSKDIGKPIIDVDKLAATSSVVSKVVEVVVEKGKTLKDVHTK
jgi:hypothetical protein